MASDKKKSESQKYCPQWSQLDLFPQLLQQERCRLNRLRESKRSKKRSTSRAHSVHKPSVTVEKIVGVSRHGIRLGEDSPHAKYTDVEIDAVFNLFDEGYSFAAIARMLDMPKSTAWAIATGRMRSTVVDRWVKRKLKI